MSNIALDFIGEARALYQYAAELEGKGRSEDDFAYFRDDRDFKNILLVELKNGDFAKTVLRQFLFEAFHLLWLEQMKSNVDTLFSSVAAKSVKEARYHYQWSAEWVIRLGDGTDESKRRMEEAVTDLWAYTGEMMTPAPYEARLIKAGRLPDLSSLKGAWQQQVHTVFEEATLDVPAFDSWMQSGGKTGLHTEDLGYLLTEMQIIQRTYPGNTW